MLRRWFRRHRPGRDGSAVRPTYPDALDLDTFEEVGHQRVALFGATTVDAIRAVLDRHVPGHDGAFYASPAHGFGELASTVDREIRPLIAERMREVLPGHRIFMVAVTSKGPHGTPIQFHHDWTYTDERRHRAVFCWCPLVDVDVDNGVLGFVPGSHRWTSGIRPSRALEVTEVHQAAYPPLADIRPMPAGTGAFFDPAQLHGSGPNTTDEQRPAITIASVPDEAELVHFHEDADGTLRGALVDDAFFTSNPYGTMPVGRPQRTPWAPAVSADDFEQALRSRGIRTEFEGANQ